MLKRVVRWTIRIVLGILLILITAGAALFVWKPEAAWLLALVILQPLISNTRPPAIAEGVVIAADWGHSDETNRKLNAALAQSFPVGTSEAALKSKLVKQGFEPPAPALPDCWPHDRPAPVARIIQPCPTYDASKMLEYKWGNFPCGHTISVQWTTAGSDEITRISGGYYVACL